eukprot:767300-Hanusia_phi.AAC.2
MTSVLKYGRPLRIARRRGSFEMLILSVLLLQYFIPSYFPIADGSQQFSHSNSVADMKRRYLKSSINLFALHLSGCLHVHSFSFPMSGHERSELNHVLYNPRADLLRLRGGSGFRIGSAWGSPIESRTSSEELKKNMQTLLEKNPSGIMGRDLRRMYKEMFSRELPLSDFNVQRPIELIEKELADTVYYTREGDGDVKYFLKKKTLDSGPNPLWHLTCHGDDNCNSVVPGDTSFEEMKLQIQEREKKMEQESKQRFDSYQASKNAQANQQTTPSNPFGSNSNPFASAFGQPQAQSSIFPPSGNAFGNSLGGNIFGQSNQPTQQQLQSNMQPQQNAIQPISGFLTNTPSTSGNSGNNLFSGGIFGSQSQPAVPKQEPQIPQENRNLQSGSLFSSPQPFQQAGLFGSTNPGQSSIFGSNPPAPAAQNPASTSLFGNPQQPSGSSSLFGATNPPQPSTTGSLFGSNTAVGSGGGGLFGSTATSASPTPSGNLFGSTLNAPKPPQTSLFGSGSSNLFGQGPTNTQSNLFGSSAPTNTQSNLFGSSAPTNTQSNLFGSSATSSGL